MVSLSNAVGGLWTIVTLQFYAYYLCYDLIRWGVLSITLNSNSLIWRNIWNYILRLSPYTKIVFISFSLYKIKNWVLELQDFSDVSCSFRSNAKQWLCPSKCLITWMASSLQSNVSTDHHIHYIVKRYFFVNRPMSVILADSASYVKINMWYFIL